MDYDFADRRQVSPGTQNGEGNRSPLHTADTHQHRRHYACRPAAGWGEGDGRGGVFQVVGDGELVPLFSLLLWKIPDGVASYTCTPYTSKQ